MASSAHFTPATLSFLKDLAQHNDRTWFNDNKARYETHVKEPSERFAVDAGQALGMKGSVFRIYRDIRFSKDKTPYKTSIGIWFEETGRPSGPGYYLHVAPDGCFAAGGLYMPEREALDAVRHAIATKPSEWAKATRSLELESESLKRPPRGFDETTPHIEDIKRKSFVAVIKLTQKQATSAALLGDALEAFDRIKPLSTFLARAIA